jgi:hypothetical protein
MDGSTAIEDKMKIKYVNSGLEEHVSNEIGKFAVKAGIAIEVVAPQKPPAYAEVTWAVRDGAKAGDFLYPPCIYAKCSRCATQTWQESNKGTAHLTIQYRHTAGCAGAAIPGVPEQVPAHIAEEYTKRWAVYIRLSRKKKVVLPALTSTNTAELDRRLMAAAGQKTREELILEAKKLAATAKKG